MIKNHGINISIGCGIYSRAAFMGILASICSIYQGRHIIEWIRYLLQDKNYSCQI